jgi:hypothetical protein
VAVPSEGGHYLVDIFGGLAVAGLTIVGFRALPLSAPAPAAALLPA